MIPELLLSTHFWLILGLVLTIADIFLGFNFFVLPFGVAALLVSAIVHGQKAGLTGELQLYTDWQGVAYWFAGLSVVSVGLLRLLFQKKRDGKEDINEY